MLLVWRFQRHGLDFITQIGGTVERANYGESCTVGFIDWLDVGAFIACDAKIKATKRAVIGTRWGLTTRGKRA